MTATRRDVSAGEAPKEPNVKSRRDLLRVAGAASAASIVSAVPALAKHAAASEPLVRLADDLKAAERLCDELQDKADAIRLALPENPFAPIPRPRGNPVFDKAWPLLHEVTLDGVRAFNRNTEAFAGDPDDPERRPEWLRRRAEGRERIRWWVAEERRRRAIIAESGFDRAEEAAGDAVEVWTALRGRIRDTPATTLWGVLIKLRIAAETFCPVWQDMPRAEAALDDYAIEDQFTLAAIADLERIVGKAVQS